MDGGLRHCTGDRDQEHPHGKEMQKGKMIVWGGLTNSCDKKRSEKQRRKGKIFPLNAEFQRIARRDKKAFLNYQSKEIDENNRMGKTRDLFKKIRDTKGTFFSVVNVNLSQMARYVHTNFILWIFLNVLLLLKLNANICIKAIFIHILIYLSI